MPNISLDQYRVRYPDLLTELLAYFDLRNADQIEGHFRPKTVQQFIGHYESGHPGSNLQPAIIAEICRRLVSRQMLSEVGVTGWGGTANSYLRQSKGTVDQGLDPWMSRAVTCAVYGFPAVYDEFGSSVIPLTNEDDGGVQIGTCFAINEDTLVTALHCIAPAKAIAIRGVSPDVLRAAEWFSFTDENMDLACISFRSPIFSDLPPITFPSTDAGVLAEVMAVGYPSVPGFHPALAAEAATISSRLTPVRGRVSSTPQELWTGTELFLITARVRGGFSGGPIFDGLGQAVGVVSREPLSEDSTMPGHRYDNAGYGTAIPASTVLQMLSSSDNRRAVDMSKVDFEAFV